MSQYQEDEGFGWGGVGMGLAGLGIGAGAMAHPGIRGALKGAGGKMAGMFRQAPGPAPGPMPGGMGPGAAAASAGMAGAGGAGIRSAMEGGAGQQLEMALQGGAGMQGEMDFGGGSGVVPPPPPAAPPPTTAPGTAPAGEAATKMPTGALLGDPSDPVRKVYDQLAAQGDPKAPFDENEQRAFLAQAIGAVQKQRASGELTPDIERGLLQQVHAAGQQADKAERTEARKSIAKMIGGARLPDDVMNALVALKLGGTTIDIPGTLALEKMESLRGQKPQAIKRMVQEMGLLNQNDGVRTGTGL